MNNVFSLLMTLTLMMTSLSLHAADDIKNGELKYQTNCMACHGNKGLGDGPLASTLSNKPANIMKKLDSIFMPKMMISYIVLKGKVEQGMPAWEGILTKQDTYDIFAYIESVQ